MQLQNLAVSSSSNKNNMPKISHYNTVYLLRYTHPYLWCLFTNIQKISPQKISPSENRPQENCPQKINPKKIVPYESCHHSREKLKVVTM